MRYRIAAPGAIMLSIALSGCDERLSDLTGPTPDLRPTFSSIQQEIFENRDSSGRPACIHCHNAAGQFFAGGMNLEHAVAYANLVNVASRGKPGATRVIPNDPESSYLVHKLEGRAGIVGSRMPLNGPYLTDGQIAVIRRWIELGALDD
jgi:hypothetical protein